jgi:hypothetical protein
MNTVVGHHQAGRLVETERIYRQILANQPNHAEASHLLGVLAGQAGRSETAVEWIERQSPSTPPRPMRTATLGMPCTPWLDMTRR